MLIQFNFENYKSFLNETSLDMEATSISEHSYNLIEYKKGEKYLKVVPIYGANASGKSNILKAFDFMKNMVLYSFGRYKANVSILLTPFKFSETGKKVSSLFEVVFSIKGFEYKYGFRLNKERVSEEWLYKRDFRSKSSYKMIFERGESIESLDVNEKLKETKNLLKKIKQNTLALSFLGAMNFEDINNTFKWFEQTRVVDFGDKEFEVFGSNLSLSSMQHFDIKKQIESFLKATDTGVDGIEFEENIQGAYTMLFNKSLEESEKKYDIFTLHTNTDTGEIERLPLKEESNGTQKLIDIYPFIFLALALGLTIFIDEMDAKLHPLLIRYIIKLFHSEEMNPKNAQLIYTTHDTTVLSKDVFRRDQIYFVEKNAGGVSSLSSLVEFKINEKKIRKDASYNKDYLSGKYGAIPILKEFGNSDIDG